MEINKDITFKEYLDLDDKSVYNYAANYSRVFNIEKDIFAFGEFEKLPFITVKDLQYKFGNNINWLEFINFVSEDKQKSIKVLADKTFLQWCNFRAYVEQSLLRIARYEAQLVYEATAEDEEAGIDNLSVFGVLIQIDKLAGGDITKYEIIKQMPYEDCFTKLLMDMRIEEYNAELNRRRK